MKAGHAALLVPPALYVAVIVWMLGRQWGAIGLHLWRRGAASVQRLDIGDD